jgi:hypothetical protein
MRAFVDFFLVNGKPMLAPDEEVALSYSDLDSDESGRDESGYMHRIVLRHKVATWSFVYSSLTEEEKRYMESLFDGLSEFEFTHPGRTDVSEKATTRCYRSSYGISWKNAVTGQWKNYKFNIIEC